MRESAVRLLEMFRSGELRPSEYLEQIRVRIARDELHPQPINAFTELLDEEAAERAHEADRRYANVAAEDASRLPPLLGLPVATKEKHGLAGRSLSQGIRSLATEVAVQDHPVVERIRRAGGIVHGRTTSPEFSCATFTRTALWGVTRNPWNRSLSPGGSSGGAGAALAAGFTPLATASDIAGSTRIPAAFCGVVGYKAPYGAVPGVSAFAADWYRGDGPMARTVEDTALLVNVMRGVHPVDHRSVPTRTVEVPSPGECAESLHGLRIGYSPTLGDYPVELGVRDQVEATVSVLADAGAIIEEIVLPWSRESLHSTAMAHLGHILGEGMWKLLSDVPDVEDYTRAFMETVRTAARQKSLFATIEEEELMQCQLAEAMRPVDALLTPVSAVRSLTAHGGYLDGITVGAQTSGEDRYLEHYWEAHMTLPFNMANRSPVLAVPAGTDAGVPVGVQIVGKPFDEQIVFDIGAALQHIRPWSDGAPMS